MGADAQWTLNYAPKYGRFGVPRTISPLETAKKLEPILDCFDVRSKKDIHRVDRCGVPAYVVKRTGEHGREDAFYKGKGYADIDARVSALMEAVERYSAERYDGEIVCGTFDQIRTKGTAVNPDDLGAPRVDDAYSKNCVVEWAQGYDLIQLCPTFAPLNLVIHPFNRGPEYFRAGSVGLASGNTMEEAISHALCEVIEHDALGVSNVYDPNSLRVVICKPDGAIDEEKDRDKPEDITPGFAFPLIDPSTFPARSSKLAKKINDAGLTFFVRNITTDIGIAAARCIVVEKNPEGAFYAFDGAGSHPDAEIALLRALSEGALSYSLSVWLRNNGLWPPFDPLLMEPHDLYGFGSVCSFSDVPSYKHKTVDEDIRLILKKLKAVGLNQAVAVDLTKLEINFPTLRIIVPGTEYLSEDPGRFTYGRRAAGMREKRFKQYAELLESAGA